MKIYGGLFLENLAAADKYFELQMALFAEGYIQGLQLRVAHPSYTPGVTVSDLPRLLAFLPREMRFVVHYGAENVGVDFGECFDECGVYEQHRSEMSWRQWNQESLDWGVAVARYFPVASTHPLGVVHVGYGKNYADTDALERVVSLLQLYGRNKVALENVPAIVPSDTREQNVAWGFGGTPADMARIIGACGDPLFRVLLDFTHLVVTVKQGQAGYYNVPSDLEQTVRDYLALPHWPICHFSGIPDGLVDNHDCIHVPPPAFLREAIRAMDTVCLEISWRWNMAWQQIEIFRTLYGD